MRTNDEMLIGFDLGTSAIKAILITTGGDVVSQASRNVAFIHPESAVFEISPEDYYADVVAIARELVISAGDSARIKAVSFCGASGNALVLDEHHNPLRNVISWLDRRTAGMEGELWPELDPEAIYSTVGWPWLGIFPLAQLAWLKNHEPEIWSEARYYTLLNDYIYYRLCGRLVTDPSKATTSYLQNQLNRRWDSRLLSFLGVGEENLSEIVPTGTVCGGLRHDASAEIGLSESTKVVAGSFDHPSAARSSGVFNQGDLLISAGTSWVAFAPLERRETAISGRMLVDPFLSPEGCWGGMFSLPAVAERIDEYLRGWLGDGDKRDLYAEFDRLASRSTPGADGFLLNPLEQHYVDSKDAVAGVERRHLARALMEGCVYLLKERIEKLRAVAGISFHRIVLVGGPTNSPIWPRILSDVLHARIDMPETGRHAGAFGAALLAGIGAGIFPDETEGWRKTSRDVTILEPDPENRDAYDGAYGGFLRRFFPA